MFGGLVKDLVRFVYFRCVLGRICLGPGPGPTTMYSACYYFKHACDASRKFLKQFQCLVFNWHMCSLEYSMNVHKVDVFCQEAPGCRSNGWKLSGFSPGPRDLTGRKMNTSHLLKGSDNGELILVVVVFRKR